MRRHLEGGRTRVSSLRREIIRTLVTFHEEEGRGETVQDESERSENRPRTSAFVSWDTYCPGVSELLPRGPSRKWDRLFRVGGNGR